MSHRIRIIFCFIILNALSASAFAQVNDAGLWMSVQLEKNITRRVMIYVAEELRMNENFTEAGTVFTEAGVEYRFPNIFRVSGAYRFIQRRRVDDFYSMRHRFLLDVSARKKFGNFQFILRERFQGQIADIDRDDDGGIWEYTLRNKLSLKYDFGKKYAPFISGELFYPLNKPEGNELDQYRVSAGIEYEFNKRSSAQLGYLVDREINVNDPLTEYVITLNFTYRL